MPKILAIDDKMDNLVTLSALLANLMPGCAVITAQSGREGIAKAKVEQPDTILLDVKMPDMDGFETCRRLKDDAGTKHIPVIMITAIKTDSQSRIKGLEIGADAFLAKPIDEYELVSQVNVALRIKKAEDALRSERDSLEISVQERTAHLLQETTERKRAEKEAARLEDQLFQSQKMDAIGTLAGGVAHDFNNILAAIIGYTEMAMEESQNEIQRRYLQETLKGAERAKNLVRQILTFSRQDSHEKKPLDFKLLLKEAVKFLRASIPATIEINQLITNEPCNILADPTQMHQIIMNLCSNAAYAMKQTGGALTIELSTLELYPDEILHHPGLKPGPYVKLTVSDTGHGIDSALQLRIFEPFFTTKSKDEGTGLGLSVVYGIVKSHDGVITVYSEPDRGAIFNVYLPRIIHEGNTSSDITGTVTGGKERILFVDDEPALVDIGATMLSSLGYEVTGVTSSMEALDLFRAAPERFDLVITDMTLPKMTGIDLSREIMQIRPEIPIILCSGIREYDTEEQVKSLGIKAYCIKPLTRRELARVIDVVSGRDKVIAHTLDGEPKARGPGSVGNKGT